MKKLKFCFIVLCFSITLISCGKPPANTPINPAFELFCKFIDSINAFSGNTTNLQTFIKNNVQNSSQIIYFKQDSTISVESYYDLTSDLFFSLDNNRFYLVRGFFITYNRKDMYLSLDGKKWAAIYADQSKNKDNHYFEAKFQIKHQYHYAKEQLHIKYSLAVSLFDENNIPYTNKKINKPIINLQDLSNDQLYFQKNNDIKTKLTDYILYVPPQTICNIRGTVNGNLVNCEANKNIEIKFKKDIFIYANKLPSLSFDGQNWELNLFKFKIDNINRFYTTKNAEVDYIFDYNWQYE